MLLTSRATGRLRALCSLKLLENNRPCLPVTVALHYHHSANLHRYFTNRYHKKVCSKCARPNILPAIACWYCSHQLTDAHIQSVGRDALRDLVLARHVNHDQSKELQARVQRLEKASVEGLSVSPEDVLRGLPQPLATEGHGLGQSRWSVELFRCFNFVISTHPFPASMVHLVAIPRASMYDVRQLRRSHIPLLRNMKEKLKSFTNLLIDLAVPASRGRVANSKDSHKYADSSAVPKSCSITQSNHNAIVKNAGTISAARKQIYQLVAIGFNYPSEYGQLCLHAVAPPIDNFGIFEPPFFYPFNKVVRDLENCGSVQVFPPSAILRVDDDSIIQIAKGRDCVARRVLGTS